MATAQANPDITINFTDACATALSVGSETDVIGSAPSNHFDVDAASDGRSVVAWQTGQPGGGASKVLVQRFDAAGNTDGGVVEVQDSPYGSGPVRVEWLSNDSVAVTFTSYEGGRYRTELRTSRLTPCLTAHRRSSVIHLEDYVSGYGRHGRRSTRYFLNMTLDHPQLPNLGRRGADIHLRRKSNLLAILDCRECYRINEFGRSISTFSAVKVDDDRVAFAVDDRSNGVDREYSVVTFNVTADLDVDSDSDGYADKSPDYQQSFTIPIERLTVFHSLCSSWIRFEQKKTLYLLAMG